MYQWVDVSSGGAALCLDLACMWGISSCSSVWSGRSQLLPSQLSIHSFNFVCSGLLSECPPPVLNVPYTDLWAGVSATQGCDPPKQGWVLGPWVSKDVMTFFLLSTVDGDLKSFIKSGESRCISLLQLWLGDIPRGQIFACKVCHWSAVGSEAAGEVRSSFSDPVSFVCWEPTPSTPLLWAFSLVHCMLDVDLTCKWLLDVAEEQAAGSCCQWWWWVHASHSPPADKVSDRAGLLGA